MAALYVTASIPDAETFGRLTRNPLARRVASAPSDATRATDVPFASESFAGQVNATPAFVLATVADGAGVGVRVGNAVGVGVGVAVACGATDPPPPPPPPQAAKSTLATVRSAKKRDSARSPQRRTQRNNGTARTRAIISPR
jgi:hypothetical protein